MRIHILVFDTDPETGTEPDEVEIVSSFIKALEAINRLEWHHDKRKVAQNNIIPEDES